MVKKILVAEDSVTMQKVVEMTFATADYAVTAVSSVDEALSRAREMRPDLVLADLSMSGKNGYDLCSAIKRGDDPIPVVILHGSAAPYDAGKGSAAGVDADVQKPFESQTLINKVEQLISGHVSGAAPSISKQDELRGPVRPLAPMIETQAASSGASQQPRVPRRATPSGTPSLVRPASRPPTPARPTPAVPRPQPRVPQPLAVPTTASAATAAEIVIDAEPPPPTSSASLPSFDMQPQGSGSLDIRSQRAARGGRTLLGMSRSGEVGGATADLPPPPPGMPLPPGPRRDAAGIAELKAQVAMLQERLAEQELQIARLKGAGPISGTADGADSVERQVAALSRELVEKVVWEVVPDLAETVIREELDRLVEKRNG